MQDALIIIDVQACFVKPSDASDPATIGLDIQDFFKRVDTQVIPNIQLLLEAFRAANKAIFFAEMGSLKPDGSDLSFHMRRINEASLSSSGQVVMPYLDDRDARTDERIKPIDGETVIRKNTTGTVACSSLAEDLRSRGCTSIAVTGLVTDCCVGQTARELSDRDFEVTLVEDACASNSSSLHFSTIESFKSFHGDVETTRSVTRGSETSG